MRGAVRGAVHGASRGASRGTYHGACHGACHDACLVVHLQAFTRLNVLHLWDFVENDLAGLGVKSLDPSAFASADFKHVSTSQMQHSLLKVTTSCT